MSRRFIMTPVPRTRESASGWVLRASAENQLRSPSTLFGILNEKGFSAACLEQINFDPTKLSHLFWETPPRILSDLTYGSRQCNGKASFRGHLVFSSSINLKQTKICPECVAQNGYVDALWDLSVVTVCHRHGRALIYKCPACDRHLSKSRIGPLICRCGASLEGLRGEAQERQVSWLHHQIDLMAFGLKNTESGDFENQIAPQFRGMSLSSLLLLIDAISCRADASRSAALALSYEERQAATLKAAQVLSSWPINFHSFLKEILENPYTGKKQRTNTFDTCEVFVRSIFGTNYRQEEVGEILEEMRAFISSYWGSSAVSGGPEDQSDTHEWISLPEVAKAFEVSSAYIRHLLKCGFVRSKVVAGQPAMIRRSDLLPEFFSKTPHLGPVAASQRLHMPCSVLSELRRTGECPQTHIGGRPSSYSEHDLSLLAERILSTARPSIDTHGKTVLFRDSFSTRMRSEEDKAHIVRGMLSGKIRTYASPGGSLSELLVNLDDLNELALALQLPESDLWTVAEASRVIGTSLDIVTELAELHAFETSMHGTELRLRRDSVLHFRNNFISFFRKVGYSVNKVHQALEYFKDNDLPVYKLRSDRYFAEKKHLDQYIAYKNEAAPTIRLKPSRGQYRLSCSS